MPRRPSRKGKKRRKKTRLLTPPAVRLALNSSSSRWSIAATESTTFAVEFLGRFSLRQLCRSLGPIVRNGAVPSRIGQPNGPSLPRNRRQESRPSTSLRTMTRAWSQFPGCVRNCLRSGKLRLRSAYARTFTRARLTLHRFGFNPAVSVQPWAVRTTSPSLDSYKQYTIRHIDNNTMNDIHRIYAPIAATPTRRGRLTQSN